MKAGKEQG